MSVIQPSKFWSQNPRSCDSLSSVLCGVVILLLLWLLGFSPGNQWAPYISGVRTWLLKVKPKVAGIEGYSTSVSVPCAEIWIFFVNSIQWNCRAGDWNRRTIAPSISAIFGFTFLLGRMTEVLTPDIYGAHCWKLASRHLGTPNLESNPPFYSLHWSHRIRYPGLFISVVVGSFDRPQTHHPLTLRLVESSKSTSSRVVLTVRVRIRLGLTYKTWKPDPEPNPWADPISLQTLTAYKVIKGIV